MSSEPLPVPLPRLPVAALVLSVVGLCLPPVLLVSLGLGAYGYWRAKRDASWAPRTQVTQMTMAVSLAGLLIFVGLALPQLKRARVVLRQRECRDRLMEVAVAERTFFEKASHYTTNWSDLALTSQPGTQLIRLASPGPLWSSGSLDPSYVGIGLDPTLANGRTTAMVDGALSVLTLQELGVHGTCPACSFTAVCAAELDGDPTIDVWTVSSLERTGTYGEKIPGGMPWNERDDVRE